MEKNFNHEESLALINEMINRARNNVQKEKGHSIFWGYLIACTAIANSILLHVLDNPNYSFWVWLIMIPGYAVSYFMYRRTDRKAFVKTHIDKIGDIIWKGYGIGVAVFIFSIFFFAFQNNDFKVLSLINTIILVMVGICEFATACIYRYKSLYLSAILFWAGAIVCVCLPVDVQFIVLALCMVLGFVVPGHILNYKAKKSHV